MPTCWHSSPADGWLGGRRGVVDWKLMPTTKDDQRLTDMGYPVYPPSLYRACSYASGLGVPVYIMVRFDLEIAPSCILLGGHREVKGACGVAGERDALQGG